MANAVLELEPQITLEGNRDIPGLTVCGAHVEYGNTNTTLHRDKWSIVQALQPIGPLPAVLYDAHLMLVVGMTTTWWTKLTNVARWPEPYPLRIWVPPRQSTHAFIHRFPRYARPDKFSEYEGPAEPPKLCVYYRVVNQGPPEE